VTSSAISHQVKVLEDYLSTALFIRHHNSLTLTLTGEGYVGKLTGLLDTLEQSTRQLTETQEPGLRVLATPGFAARWLVPRLQQMPFANHIRLRISQGAPNTDFSNNDADIVVHWSDSLVPGAAVEPFMSSIQYPVASPEFLRLNPVNTPEDLLNLTLFHEDVMDGWAEWFNVAGIDFPAGLSGPSFPHCELAHIAAEQSQGVALAYDALIKESVKKGNLKRILNIDSVSYVIYSFCCQHCRYSEPKIKAFREWIFKEVQAESGSQPKLNVVGVT
jgi:LysR family glycine cleavage system transcriptional activator